MKDTFHKPILDFQEFAEKAGWHIPKIQMSIEEYDRRYNTWSGDNSSKKQSIENEYARLGGKFQYDNFTEEKYDDKEMLKKIDISKNNYYIFGETGVGKTHFATAIIRRDYKGRVKNLSQISRQVRESEDATQEDKIIKELCVGPLVLDDIGNEKYTEFMSNLLFEIIDRRLCNMQYGLIITSNLDPENLSQLVGYRTVSRIMGLVGQNILLLKGADRRQGGCL